MKRIYLDHAASTATDGRVLEKMLPFFSGVFGNPNSLHAFGREAAKALDDARDQTARVFGCKPSELYFTSGGTEADNWAVFAGAAAGAKRNGSKRVLAFPIEHPAVLEPLKKLAQSGYDVRFLPVTREGIADLNALKEELFGGAALVCLQTVNSEIGTVQPVKEAAALAKEANALFFTDAVQAAGTPAFDGVGEGSDFVSISAHKFYGPKGVGALMIKNGVKAEGFHLGGHQERAKRGGTVFVAGAVGLAEALVIAEREKIKRSAYVKDLRDRFLHKLLTELPEAKLNGDATRRAAGNADLRFDGVNGEALLYKLDLAGVAASNGSACAAGTIEPSHVLTAIGLSEREAKSSVRFTFGKDNAPADADDAAAITVRAVKELKSGRAD